MPIRKLRAIINKELKKPPGPKVFRSKYSAKDFRIVIKFRRQNALNETIIAALKD